MPELLENDRNYTVVAVGDVVVYFSYKTPVAFKIGSNPLVVCENIWSTTTGKHLNRIDGGDKKNRVKYNEFKDLWEQQIGDAVGV